MFIWFKSQNGIITLVTIAMLSFIGYIFLEARFFLGQWIPGNTAAAIETLVVLAIMGGWLFAFSNIVNNERSGLIIALILSIILTLIALFDLIKCRIDEKFVINGSDSNGGNRAFKGNIRNENRCVRCDHTENVRWIDLVRCDGGWYNLDFPAEFFRQKRTHGPIYQSRDQYLFIPRTTFPLEKTAGYFTGGVILFVVVN